jgi:hypothetical protein
MIRLRIALEWFLNSDVRQSIAALVTTLDAVTPGLCADAAAARELWYRASDQAPDAEGDAIVEASLQRSLAPARRSAAMWRRIWQYLSNRGGDVVDDATFEAISHEQNALSGIPTRGLWQAGSGR